MPRKTDLTVNEISGLLREGLTKAVTRPTIHGYKPHDKQIQFHSSTSQGRLYIGGNRSGKTVGGIVEDVFRMRGQHPYQPVPPAPTSGRIVTVSLVEGILDIVLPELAKWIPPSDLKNGSWEDSYSKQERQLTLTNGSTAQIMTYEQDIKKFAGVPRHWTHFDEEPPKDIFNECRLRLVDYGGCYYITMTPVEGMTWVYDDIYLKGLLPGGNISVIVIDSSENPYISEAELEIALEGLDNNERQARKEGKFVQIGGLAFPSFKPDIHVISNYEDWPIAKKQEILGWTQYCSMDHGLNNPTAWLWHAVSPSGSVVTYDELYDREKVVAYYATEIHARQKQPYRRPPNIYVGDPAISQRNGQTGDSIQTAYIHHGVPIVLGNNNVPIGVEKMNRYLQQGKWAITENCFNLVRELQRVRWKVYENAKERYKNNLREEIHKKDDHAPDSCRYFFSMMPNLSLPQDGNTEASRIEGINAAVAGTMREMNGSIVTITPPTQQGLTIDEYLRHSLANSGQQGWKTTPVDEYLGSEY